MKLKISFGYFLILFFFIFSCSKTAPPSEEVLLINKWFYELMEADYQYYSILVRATMHDPTTLEIDTLIQKDENNILFCIESVIQRLITNYHSFEGFKYLPGNNPWGKTKEPVYKKLLPSEMKAMHKLIGKYGGDCSTISHLIAALCRINGIPEDDVFILRTKEHSVVLVQCNSNVYFIDGLYVENLSPEELFFFNLYWNTGLYNDRYSSKAGYVLTKEKLSGPGTLKEKFERQYKVRFSDIQKERTANEIETFTNIALQKRSTSITDIVSASERGPLVRQLCSNLTTIEELILWINENIGVGSIFSYDAFMTPDQVIVFKTASAFDKAVFLMCSCRIKSIECEIFQKDEEEYVVRIMSKQFIIKNNSIGMGLEEYNKLIPIYSTAAGMRF